MKTKELRKKTKEELKKMLSESKEKLVDLKFGIASKQLKNVMEIRKNKKSIAQILTILKEK
ncbi:MAG: large subunit ribosomal protein L29 [Parcubacteria group bacterium Athens1014_10]|nr:MAG: large subunit ribosomal protein L29 [Parcubacteria group bacterium Athens1014_10]TSD05491.1 MAG: large subunit ribosomal protein L29 [Parcubacteria group bacterium Athens0714_12]